MANEDGLNADQQRAIEVLLPWAMGYGDEQGSMAVLEGFAGSGKTYMVAALLRALAGRCGALAVMAPTHKAVSVLEGKMGTDLMGVQFGSLHSFLGLRMQEREDGTHACNEDGRASLHEFSLAVVDECSMVSEALFESLLRLKRTCRVLFVGDPAQLPPVSDNGRDSPVFRMVPIKLRLNTIVRQQAGNPIIGASVAVRACIDQGRRVSLPELMEAVPSVRGEPCAIGVMNGGTQAIVDGLVFEHQNGRSARAVAWRNNTVQTINDRTHAAMFGAPGFSVGEPLVAQDEFQAESLDNPYKKLRVRNSEEMRVQEVTLLAAHPDYADMPAYRMVLSRDGALPVLAHVAANPQQLQSKLTQIWAQYRQAKAENRGGHAKHLSQQAWAIKKAFAPVRHTYAMTAHKSQGSTFDTVFLDWNDMMGQRSDFEFNRMVYVAMTRASKFMALVVS